MQVVYDARQMSVIDGGMIDVALFGLFGFSIMAVAGWLRLRKLHEQRTLVQPTTLGVAMMSIMAVLPPIYLLYAAVETGLWRSDYTSHRYEVLEGCVNNFDETVQSDHDLGVDTFDLDGRRFTLSDSGWRVGYHVSHHHGSPIQDGAHLRVFASGDRLLRIELLDGGCGNVSTETAT
jgi:hypothetical protein